MAAAAISDDTRLLSSLAEDAQIKAVLVLHGLHPEEIEARVRKAVDWLRAHLGAQGMRVELAEISSATVRLRVHGGAEDNRACRAEIERTLMDAAPDLEAIIIEGPDAIPMVHMTALAGKFGRCVRALHGVEIRQEVDECILRLHRPRVGSSR
jgi:hypothetical protein